MNENQMSTSPHDRVENIVGKGENAGIVDLTILKPFADDKMNKTRLSTSVHDRVENIVGKKKKKMLVTSIFFFLPHCAFNPVPNDKF